MTDYQDEIITRSAPRWAWDIIDQVLDGMCSLDAEDGVHEACMTHMHDVAMKAAADEGRSCEMEGMGDIPGMDHSAHEKSEDAHKGHH